MSIVSRCPCNILLFLSSVWILNPPFYIRSLASFTVSLSDLTNRAAWSSEEHDGSRRVSRPSEHLRRWQWRGDRKRWAVGLGKWLHGYMLVMTICSSPGDGKYRQETFCNFVGQLVWQKQWKTHKRACLQTRWRWGPTAKAVFWPPQASCGPIHNLFHIVSLAHMNILHTDVTRTRTCTQMHILHNRAMSLNFKLHVTKMFILETRKILISQHID